MRPWNCCPTGISESISVKHCFPFFPQVFSVLVHRLPFEEHPLNFPNSAILVGNLGERKSLRPWWKLFGSRLVRLWTQHVTEGPSELRTLVSLVSMANQAPSFFFCKLLMCWWWGWMWGCCLCCHRMEVKIVAICGNVLQPSATRNLRRIWFYRRYRDVLDERPQSATPTRSYQQQVNEPWGCAQSSGCQFDLPIDAAWSHILGILQEKTQINAVDFGGEYIGHFSFSERSWLSKALC